ncbi:hypothetical protein [Paenibacillus polymyxa]|uniref:RCC1 domain-containing protein n=1 Tax=Paenibacillus polymyxa TaxID=1406 RepID=UPI002ED435D4|nr:hypothetical protein [Paenibacillus polymyxa]
MVNGSTFKLILVISIFFSFLINQGITYADGGRFELRYKENNDRSIFMEGLAENSKNEIVTIKIDTWDFITVDSKLEVESNTLFQGTAKVNKNGYFSLSSTPIDPAKVKRDSITIELQDQRGKKAGYSPSYPLEKPDLSDYYNIPVGLDETYYDKYKDDYTPPAKIDFSKYGVGSSAPKQANPFPISQVSNPVSIAASNDHVIALASDGTLYGWGKNTSNEINDSDYPVLPVTRLGTHQNIKKVEAGEKFSLYITKDGELYGWGDLKFLGVRTKTGTPIKITLVSEPIQDISVYEQGVALLTQAGNVYQLGGVAWGHEGPHQLMHNHYRQIVISDVVAISMGGIRRAYAVKKDGTLWYWGTAIVEGKTTAQQLTGFKDIKNVASGNANDDYLVAIDKSGNLWGWGNNTARQLGSNVPNVMYKPVNITKSPIRIVAPNWKTAAESLVYQSISASESGVLLITNNKELLLLGYRPSALVSQKLNKNVTYAETGYGNMYWITNGKIWTYGTNNEYGQLGVGVKLN